MSRSSLSSWPTGYQHLLQAPRDRARRFAAIGCAIEALERRVVFSSLAVNTIADAIADDAFLSLREAVELIQYGGDANAALGRSLSAGEQAQIDDATDPFGTDDTIVFDDAVAGGTIVLGSRLNVNGTFTIDGGDAGMTLSGGSTQATYRAMSVYGNLTLDHLTITNFSQRGAAGTTGGQAMGGAIFNQGDLTILGCTFSNNSAIGGDGTSNNGIGRGGVIYSDTGALTIRDSTFVGNAAAGGSGIGSGGAGLGGALDVNTGTILIVNSTFTQNSVTGAIDDGGAMNIWQADVTLQFVTVSDNVSTTARGIYAGANTSFVIENSILGQADNSVPDVVLAHGAMSGTNNLIRNTAESGLGVISSADPMLGALSFRGGPTQTLTPQAGSPAIDAAGATALATDQRGLPRVYGAHADLGAYEFSLAPNFTNVDHATFTTGVAGSFTFATVTDGSTPTLDLAGTLPTGVTFTDNADGTATLTGTPAAAAGGQYTLNLTAANGTSPDDVQTFTLTVNQAPAITSTNAATFTVGTAGTFTVTTTGFPVASLSHTGTLPAGLTFTDNGDGTATIAGTPADDTDADHAISITGSNGSISNAIQPFTLTVAPPITAVVAIGSGKQGVVEVLNPDGTTKFTITDPLARKSGQLRLANADITGDGTGDVIVTGGPNSGSEVAVFDGVTGTKVASFNVYSTRYKHGLFVTAADVDGDGTPDIVTGQGPGAASRVKVFSGVDQSVIAYFRAFGKSDAGARVAAADLDGDGFAEVIATRASGNTRAAVKVFDGHGLAGGVATVVSTFRPATGGANAFVATGDVDGDGRQDIVLSQTAGKVGTVSVFDGADASLKAALTTPSNRFGVRVTTADYDGDGRADVYAGTVADQRFLVNVFSGADLSAVLDTYDTPFDGNAFLG